ncbi:hypothetical protein HYH02_014410 [Chlamydomonas schloesseri]|uniref:Amine oxidase domain-containing protein n=1 Tax=Chlamydomonas schloesseri TaxID=2026947 RepID=A0A835SJE0_9CHLO|nr:hypothetical protein HYH02_014410 [Chlamydomonas schloesseri]|eukprot:KAG2428228.1 hypothetical protein HYH02_014410 [Chlamydomonas schloesseri]
MTQAPTNADMAPPDPEGCAPGPARSRRVVPSDDGKLPQPSRSLRDARRLRVAVIGGGAAGIACALSLQGYHDVVVFERGATLGGHAHSVAVARDSASPTGVRVARVAGTAGLLGSSHADVGATFFNKPDYPVFMRLLGLLGCRVNDVTGSVSITPYGAKAPLCIPFIKRPGGGLAVRGLTPRVAVWGARLQLVLMRAGRELRGVPLDYLTLAEFLLKTKFEPLPEAAVVGAEASAAARQRHKQQLEAAGRRLARKPFYDQFLLPLIQSFWGATRADVLGFSAGDCFAYFTGNFSASPLTGAKLAEVEGGLGAYAGEAQTRLANHSASRVRTSCQVTRVMWNPASSNYVVELRDAPPPAPGSQWGQANVGAAGPEPEPGPLAVHPEAFDAVVVATNGWQARRLIEGLDHAAAMREALGAVTYLPGHVAIHGDMRLLPAKPSERSLINIRIVPESAPVDGPPPPTGGCGGCCVCGAGAGAPYAGTMRGFFTAYKPWAFADPGLPVLKTWLNPQLLRRPELLPSPMYLLQNYYHAQPDLEFYKLPSRLEPLQGTRGLFLAGMHCGGGDGIGNHEAALISGLRVAARLAPQSDMLRTLWPEGAAAAPKRAATCAARMTADVVAVAGGLVEEGVQVLGRAVKWHA